MLPRTRARAIGPDTEEYRCRGRALLGEEHCDQAAVPRADVGCGGLSDLRAAVLGELEAAPDLDALRTLLRGLFEAVH